MICIIAQVLVKKQKCCLSQWNITEIIFTEEETKKLLKVKTCQ